MHRSALNDPQHTIEHATHLFPTFFVKLAGICSVGNGVTNKRNPVKNDWGFRFISRDLLAQNVDRNG